MRMQWQDQRQCQWLLFTHHYYVLPRPGVSPRDEEADVRQFRDAEAVLVVVVSWPIVI